MSHIQANGKQIRVTDHDLVEIEADWSILPNQEINFEKIVLVGSEDFSLVGRPIIPRNLCSVTAKCVEVKPRDHPRVQFMNPRAPRRPKISFSRKKNLVFRILSIKVNSNLE